MWIVLNTPSSAEKSCGMHGMCLQNTFGFTAIGTFIVDPSGSLHTSNGYDSIGLERSHASLPAEDGILTVGNHVAVIRAESYGR
jgi:hypothetical protein